MMKILARTDAKKDFSTDFKFQADLKKGKKRKNCFFVKRTAF